MNPFKIALCFLGLSITCPFSWSQPAALDAFRTLGLGRLEVADVSPDGQYAATGGGGGGAAEGDFAAVSGVPTSGTTALELTVELAKDGFAGFF